MKYCFIIQPTRILLDKPMVLDPTNDLWWARKRLQFVLIVIGGHFFYGMPLRSWKNS